MQAESIKPGQTVLVVDDLIATGMYPYLMHFGAYMHFMLTP